MSTLIFVNITQLYFMPYAFSSQGTKWKSINKIKLYIDIIFINNFEKTQLKNCNGFLKIFT